jgi:hypothetical protein
MAPIVHPVLRRAALLLLLALAWAGCSSGSKPQEAPGGSRFGNDYEILTSEQPAAPDEPPALRGDTLTATVSYPGGAETHDFALRHETRGDTTRLWLQHDAAADLDSARVVEDVRLSVPQEALRPSTIVLLNPQGGESFVLRWDGE